jgi:hypothetical protein
VINSKQYENGAIAVSKVRVKVSKVTVRVRVGVRVYFKW